MTLKPHLLFTRTSIVDLQALLDAANRAEPEVSSKGALDRFIDVLSRRVPLETFALLHAGLFEGSG